MILKKASKEAIRYACMNFHYAKSVPVNTFGYAVFNDKDEWCGVVLYGTGANNHIATMYNLNQGEVIELVRVALNGKQEKTSQVVARSLKLLKKDCPLIKIVVSYADIDQDHKGIIYQACNFIKAGVSLENKPDASWIIKGKRLHGRIVSNMIKRDGGLKGATRTDFIRKHYDLQAIPYITKGKIKYIYPLYKKYQQICVNSIKLMHDSFQNQ